ncbi:MAG: restriction endonuclease subunit S, partial [Planctomycetota bacterium]
MTSTADAATKARVLPENAVMVSCIGTLGKVGILGRPGATNQQINSIVFGTEVLAEYGLFLCRTLKDQLERLSGNSTVKIVKKSLFEQIAIPLPPLAVQERIVEVLQQADAIRRKRAEARRLADQILPAIFLDMFGDPAVNPKGWQMEPIGNLLAPEIERVNPAKAIPDKEFTYIEIAHIDNTSFRIAAPKRLLGKNAPSRARQVVRTGDVLYSMTRPNLRNIAVVPEEFDGAIATTGFAILRPKKEHDTAFIFEIVKNPVFTNAMTRFAEAKSLYPAVDESEIRRYEIMRPPHGLRAQFAENYAFLSDLDTSTRQGNGSSDLLFDNLLSRGLTGELTAEWEAANADWIAERQVFYGRLPRLGLLSLLLERRQRAGSGA